MVRRLLSILVLISFVTANMHIDTTPIFYVQYQTLEINCSSSVKVQQNNYGINVGVYLETSVFYKESTGKCMRILRNATIVECQDECKCASDSKSVSFSYNVTTENSTLKLSCISRKPDLTSSKTLRKAYEPFTNVTIISDPKTTNVTENSTLNLTCTVYGGYPLATISFSCDNREADVYTVEGSFSITAFLTLKAKTNDNNRICTCFANHILWPQPEKQRTTIIVYFSPTPTVIFDGISNNTNLYEFDIASIKCEVSGGNPLAEIDFVCAQNEKGNTGNDSSSSYSSISMNVTRDLNSEFCFCTARHQLFVNDVTGVILLQVFYPPNKPHLSIIPSHPFLDGQFVEVTCNVTEGNPHVHKYEWYIDSKLQQTPKDPNRFIYGNVSEYDNNKNVYCRVYNRYTERKNISMCSETLIFNVEYVPRILLEPKEHKLVEGDSTEVTCEAVGNPHPYVRWEYNDQIISKINQRKSVLNITDADRSIQGIYFCIAYSSSLHGLLNSSLPIQLTVNYPPDVEVVAFGYDIKEGGSVTLICNATGQPAIYDYLGWDHSHRGIDIRKSIQNNGSHLSLMQLSYQDMGKYTCKVENGIRNRNQTLIQKASHNLKVLGAPIKIPVVPAIPVFSAEQSDLLQANISFFGFPNVTNFTWYNLTSNALLITTGNAVIDLKKVELRSTFYNVQVNLTDYCYKASLDILNFYPYHSGYYALEVSNDEKRVNFTIRAVVSGPPEHPSNITFEVFRTSILVHILPGFNGGHDQYLHINYTQCGQDNMFEKILHDSETGVQSLNIDNLQPTTQYCLFVFSSNKKGYSSYNDSFSWEEFVILTKEEGTLQSEGSIYAIAGGTVGSVLAIALTIIAAKVILFLRRNRKGGDRQHLKYKSGDSYDEEEDGLKDNPLYSSSVNKTSDHGKDSFSVVNIKHKSKPPTNIKDGKKSKHATKQKFEECIEDIQLDTVYENSSTLLDSGSAIVYKNQNSYSKALGLQLDTSNKNKDGLTYADLYFAPQEGGKQFVIRGQENKTNYAFIDLNKTADPLPIDNDEIIVENTGDCKGVE